MAVNQNVSRTFATFRLIGKDVDPDAASNMLGLTPSRAFRKGDPRGESKTWPHGLWTITSQHAVDSTDLARHIEWLLDQLEPVRDQLESLRDGDVKADIDCFFESLTGHGGPTFGPQLLARIASLDLELGLDIYFAT
ncbi:MAG: DUF4279 domain-containing protein [Anaerolineales bacterium]|nr:DUF4279 domain-containing protein [Anaerolineales bacterium]